jgi:flagellar motor switch protein FliN/FliY
MSAAESWIESRTEHWLTAAWAEGACKALAFLNPNAGEFALEARIPQPESWLPWVAPAWILFPCDIAEGAGISVGCSHEVLQKLGRLALGDPEDADGLAAETYRELISQAMAAVGSALQSESGAKVHFAGGVDVEEPPDASLGVEFWFVMDGEPASIALTPNAAFLQAALGESDAGAEAPVEAQPEIAAGSSPEEELGDVPRRNLELLLDLEMEVAVSFGQTEMLLNDVLKLSVGSIVELKCQASDPVEVLVNDTVIARGEVVVVDSNYGVRITDVSSRRERIQSIF